MLFHGYKAQYAGKLLVTNETVRLSLLTVKEYPESMTKQLAEPGALFKISAFAAAEDAKT